ncbi:MAG: hypothetical protein WAK22_07610, partial [Candidatus Sulfotelmatobacter sp.]
TMNRPILIVAFALLFGASMSLSAQHGGGGHVGGGGHAGFGGGGFSRGGFGGGGFGGHAGAVRSFGGMRSGAFGGRSFGNRSSAFNRGRYGRNRSGIGLRIRSYPNYGYNCWGGYCGYGAYGYPYLGGGVDPYWWWDSGDNDSNNGYDQGYDQGAPYGYDDGLANQMQQQGIPMRPAPESQGQNYNQNYYARSSPPPAPQQQERTRPAQPTVLVFRDQHQEQVQNYAIVGETLWNFTPGRTEKIPLSDLDIPATQKANENHGVEFHLPGANEGQ